MPYAHTLLEDEKRELLRIARITLKEQLSSGRMPPGAPHRESLLAPAAVCVELYLDRKLRGYAHELEETTPLYKIIQQITVAAATKDPNFTPVTRGEVSRLVIDISVMGARQRISSAQDIQIGTHGLYLPHGDKHVTLLPQVAVDRNWTADQFLVAACDQAEIPPEARKLPILVAEIFSTQFFSDRMFSSVA